MLANLGDFNRVAWSTAPGEPVDHGFHMDYACTEGRDWLRAVQVFAEDRDVLLSAGLRRRRGMGTCGTARVLWVRTESKREVVALERFKPAPSLIVREGSTCRMVALWQLQNALTYEWVLRANKRLAHRLGCAKKWAELEFAFPAPGSCLRAGRSRPVAVRVERFEPVVYAPRQVVGGLREAPDPRSWIERRVA